MCEANAGGSFEKASRLLGTLGGLTISAKRAQLMTERVGKALLEEIRAATQQFMKPAGRRSAEPSPFDPRLLVVSMDGGRVLTRQGHPDQKWKEDKVGVVYDAIPCPEQAQVKYHGPSPLTRSVLGTMESWETLGDRLSALAHARGYGRAAQRVCIGDGAATVRSLKNRCFPDAVFILDWAHAVGHLHQTAQAAFGPGPQAVAWAERQEDRLWNGRLTPLIAQIARLSRQAGAPPKNASDADPRRILANNLLYFQTNRSAMNYPAFRQNGWPLGSGIIESTIKQVGKRLKGTEKHWNVSGAECTLQVIAHMISGDRRGDDFWKRCPMALSA